LEGVKVLDLTWVAFGPWVTKYLADHGAQVIKIESTTRPDITRLSPPYKDDIAHPDRAGLFCVFNSSKYSLTLNLKSPKGMELIRRLVKWADTVVENFGVGAMKNLGLDYQQLVKIKPDIIMVSMSILGQTGPLSSFVGFGPHGAALSGIYALTGWPDGEPTSNTLAWPDCVCPWYAVTAALAALDYRRRTGKGQFIDISQVETTIHGFAPAMLNYSANHQVTKRMGNRCAEVSPHGIFRCQGTERWCAIAILRDEQWKALCEVMDKKEWAGDARFATLQGRKANEDLLEKAIEAWTVQHTPEKVMELLQAKGIPAGVVQNAQDLFADPQLKHRNHFQFLKHPVMGKCSHPAWPAKLSLSPAQLHPAPTLGADNEYICTKILGYSDEEFIDLVNSGVLE
jgi:benzylsuccinate CoA-transferase BbsF subunit